MLADHRAPATFFMIGELAAARPEIVQSVASAGHPLGCHTWTHRSLTRLSVNARRDEILRTSALLSRLGGTTVRYFRPPLGQWDEGLARQVQAVNHQIVLWSIDPKDWARPGSAKIARRVLKNLHDGAVILLHDGGGDRTQTFVALPQIIAGIRGRGLEIVPLPLGSHGRPDEPPAPEHHLHRS